MFYFDSGESPYILPGYSDECLVGFFGGFYEFKNSYS